MRLAQVGEDLEQARRPPLFSDNSGLYAEAGPDVFKENPVRDNARELAEQAERLNRYGYADPATGRQPQIPLDRALDIVARRGLPKARPADTEPTPADAVRRARENPPSPPPPAPSAPPQPPSPAPDPENADPASANRPEAADLAPSVP
ncbi:MAG: hypothetical protein KatS3mg108_3597 [Isosphaeraceae bacterium]|nr:MAG: hypothetical protein KatS3mg108_3597 [Isosphaeraceae bacterium]